jgi:phage/plasmid-associated DNA primase
MSEEMKKNNFRNLVETVDVNILNYIIDNFKKFKPQLRWRERYDTFCPIKIITEYLSKYNGENIPVSYKQNKGFGRQFAGGSLSLQSIPREIRHAIAQKYYVDIDIVNAHPVILQHKCKELKFKCPMLTEYIENRDKLLLLVIIDGAVADRDTSKKVYLSIMNGGTADFKKVEKPSQHLLDFKNEMGSLHKKFAENDSVAYKLLKKKRISEGKTFNHKGSFINHLLCDFENQILMTMFKAFGSPINCVLCFDGIMVLKKDQCGKTIKYNLDKCSKLIKKKLKINIELKQKPMDEGLDLTGCVIKKYNFEKINLQTNIEMTLLKLVKTTSVNDHTMAKLFELSRKDDIKITTDNGDGFCWNEKTKIWTPVTSGEILTEFTSKKTGIIDGFLNVCIKYCAELNAKGEIHPSDTDEIIEVKKKFIKLALDIVKFMHDNKNKLQSATNCKNVFVFAKNLFKDFEFNNVVNRNHDMLPIAGGLVLDLITGDTRERTKEDLFALECDVEYIKECDWTDEDRQTNELFIHQILMNDPAYIKYFQIKMGSYLSGRIYRDIDINHGCGKNGKSSILNALKIILGDFMGFIGKNVIVYDPKAIRSKGGSNHTSHLIPIEGKRLIATQELEEDDVIDSEMVKKIASGDPIEGVRGCYEKKTREIQPFCKLLVPTNNIPKFDTQDIAIIDRLCFNPFLARFLNKEDLKTEKKRGKYNTKKFKYYPADNNIIDKFKVKGRPINILFSWMVAGCIEFYKVRNIGIEKPPVVESYIAETLNNNDVVGQWIGEKCQVVDFDMWEKFSKIEKKSYTTSTCDLYEQFREWATTTGVLKGNGKVKFSKYLMGVFTRIKTQKDGFAFQRIKIADGEGEDCDFS